jgi:ATP-binding cassette, subfamily B, bacterial PglK
VKSLKSYWLNSPVGKSTAILSKSDKKKLVLVIFIQIGLAVMDLLGIIAIGVLSALSVTGLQSRSPGTRVDSILNFLRIENFDFQSQAIILAVGAICLLVGKTLLSILFTRRILFFFSRRGAKISSVLVSRLLSQPLLRIIERSTLQTVFAATSGVSIITLQILAGSVVLISDVALLIVMAMGLLVIDPATALGTILVFSLLAYLLNRFLNVRARKLGFETSQLSVKSNEKMVEVLGTYRESVVRNRRDYYARQIGNLRFELADVSAESSFMPYVSKYVIETAVVLGALLIGMTQLVLRDATHAIATLAIFLAAGSRIAPALLRVQQGFLQVRTGIGAADSTFDLIDSLGNSPVIESVNDEIDVIHSEFNADILVDSVTLKYPKSDTPAISAISLAIQAGTSVAFVGPSGAGKTTLIDVLLGILQPNQGRVSISGMAPLDAIAKWPGAISYVPQEVTVISGSIRENIALGFPIEAASDELVMNAVRLAQLDEFVSNLPDGLDTQVGERGAKISGGQRQRLGIARAMFTKPRIVVLDEATSSLDGETEAAISESIKSLRGSTTVVMIAHRLSTVRNVDVVFYLSNGKILASGKFEEVRKAVPNFDRQAELMGL